MWMHQYIKIILVFKIIDEENQTDVFVVQIKNNTSI